MVYKRFYINCIIRVLILSATICLLAYLFFKTDFMAAAIFTSLFAAYQIFALIRYVTKTNRDLTRLLDSIKYSDFSQSFTNSLKGSGFEELHTAFTEVIREFQRTKIEKEEHFRFLQTIVDHVGIALIAFNPDGAVELINNAAKKLLKVPRLGNINDLEPTNPRLAQKLLALSPGGKDLVKVQQGDDLLQLSIYATGFVLRKQQLILVAMQNIHSELEEKEMKSWQTLIRVLTHEIMNSITPIASLSATAYGLLKNNQECKMPQSVNEVIGDVRDAVNTIEKRSKGLLDFIENYRKLTRIPKPDFEIVKVKNLFERVANLMKDQFEHQAIDFTMQVDPETLEITADQALIEQVLINICKNSVEAVDGVSQAKIELSAGTDGLGNPVVKVIDNGKGISKEVAEKIFIPFFTTKAQGSGIGLSLSRQIMRLHKGILSVTSKPGVETTFVLRF
ncbi:MAG: ATP-binding protein [Desulfobacterales bacterium]|jgi:nitrogen fixation/metabolism regulation signal transduction histidine kinase